MAGHQALLLLFASAGGRPQGVTNISQKPYKINSGRNGEFTTTLFWNFNKISLANMLDTKTLLGAASLISLVAALPATDPNDDDFACFSSYREHDSSSWAFEEQYTTELVSTREWVDEVTDTNVPLTTLCDGRPRALEPYKTSLVTSTETLDPPEITTKYSTYTGPSPTCTIAGSACAPIQSAFPEDVSHCEIPEPHIECDISPGYCFVNANYEQTLYYWPVTTVSGDLCSQNGSTLFAEPTSPPEPNKVVLDGYTFTSPTNYLSYARVSAVIHGRRPHITDCGPPAHTDVVVPITEPFYSMGYKDSEQRSFNFADLAPNPIPADVYNRQRKCGYQHTCSGVIAGAYTPILPLPTELLNLEPEWKSAGCRGTEDGYYITPVALQTPAPTARSKLL